MHNDTNSEEQHHLSTLYENDERPLQNNHIPKINEDVEPQKDDAYLQANAKEPVENDYTLTPEEERAVSMILNDENLDFGDYTYCKIVQGVLKLVLLTQFLSIH